MPTKPKHKNTRYKSVCFTAWDKEAAGIYEKLCTGATAQLMEINYFCFGNEICPETKKQHEQGYIQFTKQRSFRQVKKLLGEKVHFERCKGLPHHNIEYCKKEGDFYEWGDRPKQGKRADLKHYADLILAGQITVQQIRRERPMVYQQYGRTLDKLEDDYMMTIERTKMTKGIWLYGPTGVGKTYKAYQIAGPKKNRYVKPLKDGKWWDAYKQQKYVIINEFRGQMTFGELMELVDWGDHSVSRRNRQPLPFTSECVIITSPLPPEEVFCNLAKNDDLAQLIRRFEIIHMTEREDLKKPSGHGTVLPLTTS